MRWSIIADSRKGQFSVRTRFRTPWNLEVSLHTGIYPKDFRWNYGRGKTLAAPYEKRSHFLGTRQLCWLYARNIIIPINFLSWSKHCFILINDKGKGYNLFSENYKKWLSILWYAWSEKFVRDPWKSSDNFSSKRQWHHLSSVSHSHTKIIIKYIIKIKTTSYQHLYIPSQTL